MVNTLEHSLEGVIDDHDQHCASKGGIVPVELLSQSTLKCWVFPPGTSGVLDLCRLLEDLSHKLGLETGDYFSVSQAEKNP
jgi:hypothetical protein